MSSGYDLACMTAGNSLPLHDIAAAYGLCKERIRQIEDAALSKLRSSGVSVLLGDIEST